MESGVDSSPAVGRGRRLLVIGIMTALVAADQLSKAWAVSHLGAGPVSVIGTTVEFRLARNAGSAFSLFRNLTPLLAVVAIVVAVFLVRAMHTARNFVMLVALALVLGGAMGNLVDRLFRSPGFLRGHVVDFIHVGAWPTFNIADSAITIGAVLLVVASVWGGDTEPQDESGP